MARLIGNVDATGSLSTSVSAPVTNASPVSLYVPYDNSLNDTSANGHIGTAVGNAALSSTQSKFGGSSLYLDGTGDLVTYPRDTSFQLAAEDHTIEAWVYRTSNVALGVIAAQWTGSGNRRSFILRFENHVPAFYWSTSGSSYSSRVFSDLTSSLNTWHHISFVRSGSSGFCFLDGVKSGLVANLSTSVFNYPNAPLSIGALNSLSHTGGQNNFAGYIDDLRITKSVALYSQNFVPPSQAVGASLSGANETNSTTGFTSLYLPFDTDVNDASGNGFTVTANNGAAVSSAQAKFNSSLALDGTDDYLTVASGSEFQDFNSQPFTIEGFFYCTNDTSNQHNVIMSTGTGSNSWNITVTPYQKRFQLYSGGTAYTTSNTGWTVNTWHHFAVCFDGSSLRKFIDGTQISSNSYSNLTTTFSNIDIGRLGGSDSLYFNGYLDDIRVLKNFAKYTAPFTPPTSAVTATVTQTRNDLAVLYMPFDDLQDKARNHPVTANGNAAVSATQAKFGGKSLFIDASGDFITIPNNGDFNFGTEDFTISMFIRPDDVNTSDQVSSVATIIDNDSNAGTSGAWFSLHQKNAGLTFSSNNGQSSFTTSDCLTAATWHHVAVSRIGNVTTVYCDGVSVGSTSTAGNFSDTATRTLYIGKQNNPSTRRFDGYIDDLLIVKNFGMSFSNAPTAASGGEVIDTVTDTRTFSSVWNLNSPEVTEAFKAGTWPTNLDTQYTRLYLPYDADANDDSSNAYTASSSNHGSSGSISSTQAKFGGNSAYFSSANAGYRYGSGGDFDLGSNDFTIRFWLYKGAANGAFLDYRSGGGGSGSGNESYGWLVHPNGFYFAGVGWPMMSFSDLANNQWQHIAVTRSGSNFRLFVDGVQQGSTVTSSNANGSSNGNAVLQVGAQYDSGYGLTGYIDDLQIDVGYAAYTAAFTPPSSPHGGGV